MRDADLSLQKFWLVPEGVRCRGTKSLHVVVTPPHLASQRRRARVSSCLCISNDDVSDHSFKTCYER